MKNALPLVPDSMAALYRATLAQVLHNSFRVRRNASQSRAESRSFAYQLTGMRTRCPALLAKST